MRARGVPYLIDDGARYMVRDVARDFEDAISRVIPALTAKCPADAYPVRAVVDKDVARGARCNVRVVFQVRGEPYETRGEAERRRLE